MAKKNIIFADTFEVREDTEKEIRSYPGDFGLELEQLSDDIVAMAVSDHIDDWRDCEKANLNVELLSDIVIIAKQQMWNGVVPRVSRIGRNLNIIVDCPFRDIDDEEVYADTYNIRWRGSHHDGVNTAIYRVMKEGKKYDTFLQALIRASEKLDATDKERAWNRAISRYTESLRPEVASVYGW